MASEFRLIAAGTDDTHDLCLNEKRQLFEVKGIDAYAQIINCKMRTILGEKQLDMAGGLPYMQTIFADASTVPIWVAEVRKMLEALPFVIRVQSITTSIDDGVLSYKSIIVTDLGATSFTGRVIEKQVRDVRRITLGEDTEEEQPVVSNIISFVNYEGGQPIAPIVAVAGSYIKLPSPRRDDYVFLGWYKDSDFTEKFSGNIMPDENITLYAKYDSYTTLLLNSDEISGERFTLRIWSNEPVVIDWGDGFSETVTGTELPSNKRDPFGGKRVHHIYPYVLQGRHNFELKISSTCKAFKIGDGPTSGYDAEWKDQPSKRAVYAITHWGVGIESAFRSFSCCENFKKMDAEWPSNITYLDAIFESSGIEEMVDWPEGVTDIRYAFAGCVNLVGNIPEIPQSVTRCNNTFDGCVKISPTEKPEGMTDEEYNAMIMPSTATTTGNYVSNTNDEVRALYTSAWGGTANIISFVNYEGGQPIAPIVATAGSYIRLPSPNREDYVFLGWYKDSGFTEKFSDNIMPNENITLYAKYDSYTTTIEQE